MYLSDLAPKATIMNLTTGQFREIMQAAVIDKAPCGLRRMLLKEEKGGVYRETGEFMELTEQLIADMEDVHRNPNSWMYDWPHMQVESEGDKVPELRQAILDKLTASMAIHGFDFQITGLQRRYLMYFSDGDRNSQKYFKSLIPAPTDGSPFRRDGELRRKYQQVWDSQMRDAKVPYPSDNEKLYGGLRPCLYYGPAWVVRFSVDGQDPLMERCRVYVNDEGTFIGSDWCQRHDFSSYHNGGINLQMGIYSFDGWVVNACLPHAMAKGAFKPKNVTMKREHVRELLKKSPVVEVPEFSAVFDKYMPIVEKSYAEKKKKAGALKEAEVDAGPITPEAMADAIKVAQDVFASKKAPDAPAIEERAPVNVEDPAIARYQDFTLYLVPNTKEYKNDGPLFVAVKEPNANGFIELHQVGSESVMNNTWSGQLGEDTVVIQQTADDKLWYWGSSINDILDEPETIETGWWVHNAAELWKKTLRYLPQYQPQNV